MSQLSKRKKAAKGVYGDPALPVSKAYPKPRTRNRWLLISGLLALLALALAAGDALLDRTVVISNGPLSSAHANLASDCAACHSPFGEVENTACSSCHERASDQLGVYTLAAHYLYRTTDFQRLGPSDDEVPCTACHSEHEGRQASLVRSPDGRCLSCHDLGSSTGGHPEFDALTVPDDDSLTFAHGHHVAEVMDRQQIAGLEDVTVEGACLACHQPEADGKSFQPLDFDRHCDACHLTTTVRTEPLPVLGADGESGVETLEMIQARGGPGVRWAYFINPGEFRQLGSAVIKSPLYHRDPWVLENLRQLRRQLYPQADLADLLTSSADVPPDELAILYREATAGLREAALGLRGRPEQEVQAELERIDVILEELDTRLEDPFAPLDESRFLLALGPRNENLSQPQAAALEDLAAQLTRPCRQCHQVENATVKRVRADQRTLGRAEFNHHAHVLQLGCLECHTAIPIERILHGNLTETEIAAVDRAEVQNLPSIERCQACHNPQVASDRCITCHLFHPDPTRQADLRRKPVPRFFAGGAR